MGIERHSFFFLVCVLEGSIIQKRFDNKGKDESIFKERKDIILFDKNNQKKFL